MASRRRQTPDIPRRPLGPPPEPASRSCPCACSVSLCCLPALPLPLPLPLLLSLYGVCVCVSAAAPPLPSCVVLVFLVGLSPPARPAPYRLSYLRQNPSLDSQPGNQIVWTIGGSLPVCHVILPPTKFCPAAAGARRLRAARIRTAGEAHVATAWCHSAERVCRPTSWRIHSGVAHL
eukprot:COSAG02_NODE_90_length_37755_cov_29.833364_3_plen_177_part_00